MAADYRSVQTRMWREDEWFENLDTEARLFWIYLFTNPSSSPAGIFRLTMRTMANESGIPFDRSCELMERFAADKKAYYNGGIVWIVNMRRLQFPDLDGSGAWQVATKIQKDIDDIPDANPLKGEYLRRNGYPIIIEEPKDGKPTKRVSIQYGYPIDTQSVNVTKHNETEPQPNEGNVAAAVQSWEALGLTINPFTHQQMIAAVDEWAALGHPEYVAEAIVIAGKANKRSWSYVEGILRRCRADGTAPGYTNGQTPSKVVSMGITTSKPTFTQEELDRTARKQEMYEQLLSEGVIDIFEQEKRYREAGL